MPFSTNSRVYFLPLGSRKNQIEKRPRFSLQYKIRTRLWSTIQARGAQIRGRPDRNVIPGRKEWGKERDGVPSLVGAGAGACAAAAAAGMKMATRRAATATAPRPRPSGALATAIPPRESLPLSSLAPEEERAMDGRHRPPRHGPRTRAPLSPLFSSLFRTPSALLKKKPRPALHDVAAHLTAI